MKKLTKKQKDRIFAKVISKTPIPDISIDFFPDNYHTILPLWFNCNGDVIDNRGNIVGPKLTGNQQNEN